MRLKMRENWQEKQSARHSANNLPLIPTATPHIRKLQWVQKSPACLHTSQPTTCPPVCLLREHEHGKQAELRKLWWSSRPILRVSSPSP